MSRAGVATPSAAGTALHGVRTRYRRSARALDLALTLLLLPLLAPVAALVALAVTLDSPGPVLYRSTRVGRDGRRFQMLKFRTMLHRVGGPSVSREGDERYTQVGRLLAATRLDELPQAWNVLRGQMRLVGPRPEVECFVLAQPEAYRRILAVPPGVTGPTQLAFADEGRWLALMPDPERGYRDELLPQKVALDLRYVRRASLLDDCGAIARTWLVPARQLRRAVRPSAGRLEGIGAAVRLARATMLALAAVAMVVVFAAQGQTAL